MTQGYLPGAIRLFKYYKSLGDKTMSQLGDEHLFWQYNADSNSIATIVKHLAGNMRSRFTDFLASDGEKEWRNRDAEFENDTVSRTELVDLWEKGWQCLFEALNSLRDEDLDKEVQIRNQVHTVLDAINRQLAHYPMHIGQIVYIGKMLMGERWQSLSIPRGKSQDFNAEKFAKPVHREHFTTEFLHRDEKPA